MQHAEVDYNVMHGRWFAVGGKRGKEMESNLVFDALVTPSERKVIALRSGHFISPPFFNTHIEFLTSMNFPG